MYCHELHNTCIASVHFFFFFVMMKYGRHVLLHTKWCMRMNFVITSHNRPLLRTSFVSRSESCFDLLCTDLNAGCLLLHRHVSIAALELSKSANSPPHLKHTHKNVFVYVKERHTLKTTNYIFSTKAFNSVKKKKILFLIVYI